MTDCLDGNTCYENMFGSSQFMHLKKIYFKVELIVTFSFFQFFFFACDDLLIKTPNRHIRPLRSPAEAPVWGRFPGHL